MSAPRFSICVYCGSRPGQGEAFVEAARSVGQWIGQQGGQLVYGGGHNGLAAAAATDPAALVRAGAKAPAGERSRLLRTAGDLYLSQAERDAGDAMMACVSRAQGRLELSL